MILNLQGPPEGGRYKPFEIVATQPAQACKS